MKNNTVTSDGPLPSGSVFRSDEPGYSLHRGHPRQVREAFCIPSSSEGQLLAGRVNPQYTGFAAVSSVPPHNSKVNMAGNASQGIQREAARLASSEPALDGQ